MPSHPGSLPYTRMKRSESLILLELLENPDNSHYMAMIHDYAVNGPLTLVSYLVYADELDFMCEKE